MSKIRRAGELFEQATESEGEKTLQEVLWKGKYDEGKTKNKSAL